MAIQFHEGLSGSGKSYEAVIKQIMPKIKEGRKVVTNIRGMNHEKIAELNDQPLEEVKELLIQLEWSDTLLLPQQVVQQGMYRDAYIVLDEIQDFYPADRTRLDPVTTEFVTQHRQFGIDMLLMGQSLKDVHSLWRRRIQLKIFFINKEPVGKPTEYIWQSFMQTQPDKWSEGDTGNGEYDEKYFGTYKSHHDEVDNTTQSLDQRGNIMNKKSIKYGLPAAGLVFIAAVVGLIYFFNNAGDMIAPKKVSKNETTQNSKTTRKSKSNKGSKVSKPEDEEYQEQNPYKQIINGINNGQFAYIGYVQEGSFSKKLLFELRNSSGQLISFLSQYELNNMGIMITKTQNLVHVTNKDKTINIYLSQTGTKPSGSSKNESTF